MNNIKTIFLCPVILMLLVGGVSYAESYLLDSAHGNSTYGVDRTSTSQYATGHCAHCHEQHASIGGEQPDPKEAMPAPSKFCLLADNFSGQFTNPYAQSDNACFYCHCVGTYQTTAFDNYSYGRTFGGNPDATPASVMDAFNIIAGSYHNLNDVLNFAKSTSGWPSTFTADSNPCSACHNVHIAQRSCGKPAGSYDPTKSAISKPSDHGNLWGNDDGSERMDAYTSNYRAPFYVGAIPTADPTLHEPDGVSGLISSNEVKGLNLPDYVTFCTDCHNATNSITSHALGTLKIINWAVDQHGKTNGIGSADGDLKAPYTSDGKSTGTQVNGTNFVLSCLDCHEPHGSSNEYLLRTTVNGTAVSIPSTGRWYNFCSACHSINDTLPDHFNLGPDIACNGCHSHGLNF
ncbi:MAG: cytochrome c3 family protein [Deltaproteobacteria bacterium]|nr:cytochrome c3 family protein [Deltaproteobacteria bacterium]